MLTKTSSWAEIVAKHNGDKSNLPWRDEDFCTYWIVAGHHIRKQVSNDRAMVQFLRRILPPYSGSSLVLFRGESRQRFLAGEIGLAWCPDQAVAEMFARGLNSIGGGLVLRATFEPAGIISEPNAHSRYLGECQYTADPKFASGIEIVAEFPQIAA